MKMRELTLSQREALDKLNSINIELESNQAQSLSNVCWGYLNHKFDESLLSEPKAEIKKKLKYINEIAPRIITSRCDDIFDYTNNGVHIKSPVIKNQVADVIVKPEASVKEVETEVKIEKKSTPKTKKEKVVMNTLF